ncbi:MAG: FAD-binding protein [Candidatus Borkfalkiaceae bacterium]|nr:FAD-binding protein [Clostridia bacterium]MDY6222764.1 FAD-binding protein [Christensenellaceae bacterium]
MNNLNFESYDAIVVGTGAAGYNAACRIRQDGRKTVAIVTEAINAGTSRNTGSDKQTYYKLGLSGDFPDSVRKMANDLFSGGSMDGDNALCEAALSARCFMNLCELGVPFPVNRYGEYVGYKTDHDPFERATSAGPLTSKFMTECLQKQAERLNVPVFDHLLAVEILKDETGVCGLLCINNLNGDFAVFRTANVILATGGPAGIYADSAYPLCHTGSTALALDAGAALQNMTEWQYGLASVNPRWNVSGTYMQVLPRFVSIDENNNEYEFLSDYFSDIYEALSMIFLKGYQWPFDSRKILNGSSVIDLLVYRECVLKGRRVYLDFTKNPFGLAEIEFKKLSPEAYAYLIKAEACFGTPVDRLRKMNAPAVELYKSKGLDITERYLQIALCAQHNNGGIAVDMWWQTSVPGLFAAGECAGTHGITRPGGSALNAGQAGSLRAAQYICSNTRVLPREKTFIKIAETALTKHGEVCIRCVSFTDNAQEKTAYAMRRMSDCGGAIRNENILKKAITETKADLDCLFTSVSVSDKKSLYKIYKLKDVLTVQYAVLCAMLDFSRTVKKTRGSALYYDANGTLRCGLEETFRFCLEEGETLLKIQEVRIENGECKIVWRNVRPIPENTDFFENVWRQYRENKNIY